jgi:hypothetical protein
MKLFTLVSLFLISGYVNGQDNSNGSSLQRYTSFEVALVNGDHMSSFNVQGKAGIKFNKTLAGVGAGIDGYRFRSVPVFLDLQQEFGKKSRRLFVFVNGGYNFPWVTERDKVREGFIEGKFSGRVYYDAGIGLKLQLPGTNAVLFSAGYSGKHLKKVYNAYYCPWGVCQTTINKVDYKFSRIVFRAGWQF